MPSALIFRSHTHHYKKKEGHTITIHNIPNAWKLHCQTIPYIWSKISACTTPILHMIILFYFTFHIERFDGDFHRKVRIIQLFCLLLLKWNPAINNNTRHTTPTPPPLIHLQLPDRTFSLCILIFFCFFKLQAQDKK